MRQLNDIEKATLKTLAPLICAYQSAKIDDELAQTYAIALADIDQIALAAAVIKCLRTKKFFPAIMEIREEVESLTAIATGTKAKSPDEAWKELLDAQWKYWPYQEPEFSTDAIKQTVLAMGWRNLCTAEQKDIGITRAQFLKMYESVCNRKREAKINNDVLRIMGVQVGELVSEAVKQIGSKKG
jgi:hypothetical protein